MSAVASSSKNGDNFRKLCGSKIEVRKNAYNKNGLLNWYSFKWRKKRKKKIFDLWHRNSTLDIRTSYFLVWFCIYKNKMVFFEDVDLRAKTLLFRTKFHSGLTTDKIIWLTRTQITDWKKMMHILLSTLKIHRKADVANWDALSRGMTWIIVGEEQGFMNCLD